MARIFVSYRRDDASSEAGRITDWLDRHFGEDDVFMDINALEPGVDFVQSIEHAVNTIDALIAVIGPDWVDAVDDNGLRRLEDESDWVRLEIGNALKRGIRVIPVLVNGAAMPPASKLPEDLQLLRRRNALPLTERQWRAGIDELIKALDGVVTSEGLVVTPPPPPPKTATPTVPAWAAIAVAAGAVLVLSGAFLGTSADEISLNVHFGGAVHFHGSSLLWGVALAFAALPLFGIAAAAFAALRIARRTTSARAVCGGAMLLTGIQAVALYAGALDSSYASHPEFLVLLFGGLLIGAPGFVLARRSAGDASGAPLEFSVRAIAVLGALVMVAAMKVNFNNGGTSDSTFRGAVLHGWAHGHVQRWDLYLIALVAVAIGLLAPALPRLQPVLRGMLVACGIGAVCIWPRFIVVPLLENRSIASPGIGGFVGLAAAGFLLLAGSKAVRARVARESADYVTASADR